jgi:hypothetical protein
MIGSHTNPELNSVRRLARGPDARPFAPGCARVSIAGNFALAWDEEQQLPLLPPHCCICLRIQESPASRPRLPSWNASRTTPTIRSCPSCAWARLARPAPRSGWTRASASAWKHAPAPHARRSRTPSRTPLLLSQKASVPTCPPLTVCSLVRSPISERPRTDRREPPDLCIRDSGALGGASALRRDHARRAGLHVGICDTAAIVGRESCDRAGLGTCRRRASRGCLCRKAVAFPCAMCSLRTAPLLDQYCGWRQAGTRVHAKAIVWVARRDECVPSACSGGRLKRGSDRPGELALVADPARTGH